MALKNDNLKEAIELLKQGKKLWRNNWTPDEYAYLDVYDGKVKIEDGKILSESLQAFKKSYAHNTFMFFEYVGSTNAPVQKDKTYTSDEAIELLKQGKKIALKNWTEGYYYLDDCFQIRNQKGEVYYYNMTEFMCYASPTNWMERIIEPDTSMEAKILRMDESNNEDILGYPVLPGRCCKCDSPDEWNSKGKDGKWYCYKHC
jgi:Cu2+-containing amine oxidase